MQAGEVMAKTNWTLTWTWIELWHQETWACGIEFECDAGRHSRGNRNISACFGQRQQVQQAYFKFRCPCTLGNLWLRVGKRLYAPMNWPRLPLKTEKENLRPALYQRKPGNRYTILKRSVTRCLCSCPEFSRSDSVLPNRIPGLVCSSLLSGYHCVDKNGNWASLLLTQPEAILSCHDGSNWQLRV